jgi:hypothetical protein
MDLSYSMIIEKEEDIKHFKVDSRKIHIWVKDSDVKDCYNCKRSFSFFLRKHHCRMCGKIFCYNCSDNKIIIPDCLKNENLHQDNIFDFIIFKKDINLVRVCDKCHKHIKMMEEILELITIFDFIDIDIYDYMIISKVCRTWRKVALQYLSKFREIQYHLPHQPYSDSECRMLWNNRKYLINHNKWFIQLVRSINYDSHNFTKKTTEIINLYKNRTKNKNNRECWNLMCSRNCSHKLLPKDSLFLLDKKIKCTQLRQIAINVLQDTSLNELNCYLFHLIYEMGNESLKNFQIGQFLLTKSYITNDIEFINNIYWNIIVFLNKNSIVYQYFFQQFNEQFSKNPMFKRIKLSNDIITKLKCNEKINICVPCLPKLEIDRLIQIKIGTSSTHPLHLKFNCSKGEQKILYKHEDVRKDYIIMNLIKISLMILQNELNLSLDVLTYSIMPVSTNSGFIEIIGSSKTLYSIQKKFSIQNYLIEHNNDSSNNEIRYKFLKSCAFYTVFTYLLGIGDRHLENILISKKGDLFHIDFGYILGDDPKLIVNKMRITTEMIDALGGKSSKYYHEFIKLCNDIFNCLRRYVDIYVLLLLPLAYINPTKFNIKNIIDEVIKRFIPGENYAQAEIQLINNIEDSTKDYNYTISDFFHYHKKENTIYSLYGSTIDWIYSIFE